MNPLQAKDEEPAIEVSDLTYRFSLGPSSARTSTTSATKPAHALTGLSHVSLTLPAGSRTVLVGANGAGKTTLLRLLAGQKMPTSGPGSVRLHGADAFDRTARGVTYLGTDWVSNERVKTDISAAELLASVGGAAFPARRAELVRLLDIDEPGWRMHALSDGERRRVQLAMGLVRPWSVLLLDEITVDLDLLTRLRFLGWLRRETERPGPDGRRPTVVYATHIFDNLADWPTHLVHMHLGRVRQWGPLDSLLAESAAAADEKRKQRERDNGGGTGTGSDSGPLEVLEQVKAASPLNQLVLTWLAEDLAERGPRAQAEAALKRAAEQQHQAGIGGYGFVSSQDLQRRGHDRYIN